MLKGPGPGKGSYQPLKELVFITIFCIYRRVAALQERESHGASSRNDIKHKGPAPGKGQYKGMSQADVEIQQRLEKLKEKSPKEGL